MIRRGPVRLHGLLLAAHPHPDTLHGDGVRRRRSHIMSTMRRRYLGLGHPQPPELLLRRPQPNPPLRLLRFQVLQVTLGRIPLINQGIY